MSCLKVRIDELEVSLEFKGKPTVGEVLFENGIYMSHPCGGLGRCGLCRIEVSGEISAPDAAEQKKGYRLSCRTRLIGDAEVILTGRDAARTEAGAEPAAEERIEAQGSEEVRAEKAAGERIGAAVDIGTTNVVASVVRIEDGEILWTGTAPNPQSAVSADVAGRISYVTDGFTFGGSKISGCDKGERLQTLQRLVCGCIDRLLEASGFGSAVQKCVFTGNTVMLHLLTGTDPAELGVYPFTVRRKFGENVSAGELGLTAIPSGTPVYLPECISAYVGADLVCSVNASGMCRRQTETSADSEFKAGCPAAVGLAVREEPKAGRIITAGTEPKAGGIITAGTEPKAGGIITAGTEPKAGGCTSMLADIGTNGELALIKNNILYVTSTSAGPAFEGIGLETPLRGSELVEKLAEMLARRVIDSTGAVAYEECKAAPESEKHPAEKDTGQLRNQNRKDNTQLRYLTQKDVRQLQLAKAALSAGMKVLLKETHTRAEEVERLYIAGAFGCGLDINAAVRIGLIPKELKEKTCFIGNAALEGARMLLKGEILLSAGKDIPVSEVRKIELGGNDLFEKLFIEELEF